ncbi:MAG: hypothetical protein M3378_00425 [Actinomycetota bacterium]|nr:hypothetical protein [Actinomycetota bacterium]MDQ3679017.1 hypothetical protein [Actinomycetota bacterium]
MTAVDDVTRTMRDAAYVAVGLGVLGFQQAQVRRRELAQQLQSQRPELESQVAGTRHQISALARDVEQRLEPVMVDVSQRVEPVIGHIESRLPEQAMGVWVQVRKAAKEAQDQLRARVDQQKDAGPSRRE